ncbi:MAG TPA: hypothetical protein VK956_10190 [Verrucomicrobium sp.]|nr:hypothetical protein [Verrucomicrobium sp.]
MNFYSFSGFCAGAAGMLFLSSCSLLGLRKQVNALEAHGGITLLVTPAPQGPAQTYAVAWTMAHGVRKASVGFQEVGSTGLAAFSLRLEETYRAGAFTDENGNREYDAGEPMAMVKDIRPLPLGDSATTAKVHVLTLRRDHGLAAGTRITMAPEDKKLGGSMSLALGEVASLDEPRFAPKEGGNGLWRPLEFLTNSTPGIYFTEPYDPARIPVLFVYGIGGSPQDWKYFIDHFDRKRHQLWFYHYPSGMRLGRVSNAMTEGLRLLKQQHGFSQCYVVAHSMGGLVSRPAIVEAVTAEGGGDGNFIPRFVSISTPWGGHQAAASGIRHLKTPVPSWIDVCPGSDYLLKLYNTPLPKGTSHDLIYGSIKGGPFYLKGENDGVVTVESETDLRVKKSTSSFQHLFHDHVGILNQDETVKLVEERLR